jgi:DNA-directed RNA polymerase subunit RPC12/RpoP
MIAEISPQAFESFFAWAPWVIGAIIYFVFWVAKRHETGVPAAATATATATYACASCGRRGTLDQMVPQHHGGAVGYQCASCASEAVAH